MACTAIVLHGQAYTATVTNIPTMAVAVTTDCSLDCRAPDIYLQVTIRCTKYLLICLKSGFFTYAKAFPSRPKDPNPHVLQPV